MNEQYKMNEKEVNGYMEQLFETRGVSLKDLEREVWGKFAQVSVQIDQADKQIRQAQQEVERGKIFLQRANGQREAFINLLVSAETSRRSVKYESAKLEVANTLQDAIDKGTGEIIPIDDKVKLSKQEKVNDVDEGKSRVGSNQPAKKSENTGNIHT